MRRVGIFGGSFDPPHRAHIKMALLATESIPLDLLYFIPSYQAPLKEHQPLAAPEHRVAMLEQLTGMQTGWSVHTYEIKQQRPVATIETVGRLTSNNPEDSYFLIIGGDQLAQFDRWEQADRLAEMVQIVCFTRNGFQPTSPNNVQTSTIPLNMAVSSSMIRDRISKGEIPEELLLPEIAAYIQKHKLYR
ncbi:nicotinate (nicotinamide) nucleotide adenylyltransferase [Candidatus Neomarinimicrobiota bacterium]